MKLITQIIALLMLYENILQVGIAIVGVLFLVKFTSAQVKIAKTRSVMRKRRKALEDNMWAIN